MVVGGWETRRIAVTLEVESLEGGGPEQFHGVGTLNEERPTCAGAWRGGRRHAEEDRGDKGRVMHLCFLQCVLC